MLSSKTLDIHTTKKVKYVSIINKQKIIFTNPAKYYVKCEIVAVINIPVKNLQYNPFKFKKLDASQQIKDNIIIPPANKVWGVYRNRPVRPSVRLSVCSCTF